MGDDVTVELVLQDAAVTGHGRVTTLRLHWRRQDPLAVTLTLSGHPDHPALPRGSWDVLRDFLRYGLEQPTGDGAVRITPEGSRVRLALSRGHGRPCTVSLPAATVHGFLAATEAVVPSGEERNDEAIEQLIDRLLRRTSG